MGFDFYDKIKLIFIEWMAVRCWILFCILTSPIRILNLKLMVKLEKSSRNVLLESLHQLEIAICMHLLPSSCSQSCWCLNLSMVVVLIPGRGAGNIHWGLFPLENQLLNIYQHATELYLCCFAPKLHTHTHTQFPVLVAGNEVSYISQQHWLSTFCLSWGAK